MTLTQKRLKRVFSDHKKWLLGTGGSRADLFRADLSGANLSWAKLSRADLSGADLSRAILSWAKLSWADMSGANLSRTDLSEANLSRANLSGADLSGAKYDLFDILKLNINNITNELVLELMRWDATICGQDKMSNWANGGSCPFSGNIARLFYFPEQRKLWVSGNPTTSLLELWQWIAREKKIKI